TVKLLDEADKANKSGKLVLDYDPFCGCQVAMFGATPSKAIIEGNVATVPTRVMAGLSKSRAEALQMKVVLHRIDGRWQIWDFIAIDGKKEYSFRGQTLKNLAATRSKPVDYTVMTPNQFQVFVRRWTPEDQPYCAVLTSSAQWQQTLLPAAVGRQNKPFAPPAAWWSTHEVALIARSSYGGSGQPLHIRAVRRDGDRIVVDYDFAPRPKSSWTSADWIAVALGKPSPQRFTFVENGRTVCPTSR
ncbi:MAG TPA: DUF3828 domain-containing protein, partial [Candidatus Aquilonibacter sp.]|nr:DUF3828 domain-containing protein [Candidatus Aquilonibacter sp.]